MLLLTHFYLACGVHRSKATKCRWHDAVTPMADILKLGEDRCPCSHGPRERTACPNHTWGKATIQGLDSYQRRRILGMGRHDLAASPWHVSPWPGVPRNHSSAMGPALSGQPGQHIVLVAEQVQGHPATRVREERRDSSGWRRP